MAGCALGVQEGCCGFCACSILHLLLGRLFGCGRTVDRLCMKEQVKVLLWKQSSMYNSKSYKRSGQLAVGEPASMRACLPARCVACCVASRHCKLLPSIKLCV